MALLHSIYTPSPFAPSSRRIGRSLNMSVRALHASSIRTVQQDIQSKNRSAVEILQQFMHKLKENEDAVHSFITVDEEAAFAQARDIDKGQRPAGPLAGVVLAIKDNICTRGLRTTAGSRVLETYVPSFDATVVAKLRAAGAVIVGKANMDEFGMGSSTENSAFKVTRNPWDTGRVPGGSSGGSASAVAANQCMASLGSDTGGSIRQPAHFCGIVGLKPTYGRVSRYGLIAYASSLDVIGPLTHSVEDAAIMLNAIAGHDPLDATTSRTEVPDFAAGLQPAGSLTDLPLRGKRVGLVTQTMGEGVQTGVAAAVKRALQHLESLGAVVEEVSLPSFELGLPAYYILALSEASSNLARYDGVRYGVRPADTPDLQALYRDVRGVGLGPEVKRRILMGTYALSAGYYDAYYKRAQQVRSVVQREMGAALERYDVLASPAAPVPAFQVGEKVSDPLAMYKEDLMTVNLNLSGLPAVVVPCGYVGGDGDAQGGGAGSSRLPVGLQLMGRAFGEADLLQLAHVFELTATGSLLPEAQPVVC